MENTIDWRVRTFVYEHFVEQARPPTVDETAAHSTITADEARAVYHRLHDAHAFFLQPGTDTIRMANPLSAVETPYRVHINERMLYANCAWDMLGIPAMLHSDAHIEAVYTESGTSTTLTVSDDAVTGDGIVHFLVPFRHWYDDLLHT